MSLTFQQAQTHMKVAMKLRKENGATSIVFELIKDIEFFMKQIIGGRVRILDVMFYESNVLPLCYLQKTLQAFKMLSSTSQQLQTHKSSGNET